MYSSSINFLINLLPRLFEALPHLGVITLHCRLLDSVCQSEQNDTPSGQIGERYPLLAVQRPEVRVPARVPVEPLQTQPLQRSPS